MIFDEFEEIIELIDSYKLNKNKSDIYFIKKRLLKLEKKISKQINPNNKEKLIIILSTLDEIYKEYFSKNEYDLNELNLYLGILLNLKDELKDIN